jgi:hypothetical protein
MRSIFEAATLAVYKIEPARNFSAADTVLSIIKAAKVKDPLIRDNFQACSAKTSKGKDIYGIVYISLPLAVHERDRHAWKHVDYLRRHLSEVRKLECVWAPSNTNDRSRAVSYVITLAKPGSPSEQTVKPAQSSRFGDRHRDFRGVDPRLAQPEFRLQLVNNALAKMGLKEVPLDWGNDSDGQSVRSHQKGQATGNITVGSPTEVRTCLAWASAHPISVGWSKFNVTFQRISGLITPTSCTTIGLVVIGDGFDYSEHCAQLNDLLGKYHCINNTPWPHQDLVTNVRMSEENPRYLLCDPCDLVTAQAVCELKMENGRFFRQVFFANLKPAYYRSENEIEYGKRAKALYHSRCARDDGHPCYSGSTIPFILEIEDNSPYHGRTKPSELDDLRRKRLNMVYEWYMNQERNDPDHIMSPHRVLLQIHAWNLEIARKTECNDEHAHNASKRYQEDSDALETQINLHEETQILDDGYQWAKTGWQWSREYSSAFS